MNYIKSQGNKAFFYDCLNESVKENKTIDQIKSDANKKYSESGRDAIPFLDKQEIIKDYFN